MRHIRQACHGIITLSAVLAVGLTAPPGIAQPVSLSLSDIIEAKAIDSLSVSPDGQWIAYRIIAKSVEADSVQGQWYKIRLDGQGEPVTLGRPFVPLTMPLLSLPQMGVSRWAPDSSSLYTLTETDGAIEVHRLSAAGDKSVTRDAADVESFSLSADGRSMSYQVRDPRETIARTQRAEEARGFHFDRTIITDGLPLTDNYRIGSRATTIRRVSSSDLVEAGRGALRTKQIALSDQAATPVPRPAVTAPRSIGPQDIVAGEARLPLGKTGMTAVLRQVDKGDVDGPVGRNQLEADLPGGKHVICEASFCRGAPTAIRFVTFDDTRGEIVFLSEADFSSRTTIRAWNPVTGTTRIVRAETGALDDGSIFVGACPMVGHDLVCVETGPTRPPRLIRIDIQNGREDVLVDPNAALAAKHFPQSRVITWQDPSGRPWNGVLVLPDREPPKRLPLVITTYRCRGFLQGGTAWLASEFALAQQGIAALCMNTNNDIVGQRDASGAISTMQPYKDLDASYQAVIGKLTAEGIIDPARVGIAGHSFSANAATYAISHTSLFRAAVIGSGPTIDPGTYAIVAPAGDSWRKAVYRVIGLPKPSDDPGHIWETVSPALNARSVTAALLIQTPESEYLFNLQQYAFLQDAHKEVDMYVYPGEGHMASGRPIHQYWRNKRSIDWFVRWLKPAAGGG
ncbi:MAG: Atxe2 family lasso peptide isopeptidase [Sphingomonadales bacterium]|nr:Atxe2 family lasso peptide isopeptidase [Sphingomonadales bacterium]MDE2169402.1 Atxe2 family lasso peptide isopeptidase [Sphingomonadales bacterium]